jgi:hypothetical protein
MGESAIYTGFAMAKELKYPKAIINWPEDERPREKLLKLGADKLSDTELLAILLRVGSSGKSVNNYFSFLTRDLWRDKLYA